MLLVYFLAGLLLFGSTTSKQFYDPNSCASNKFSPGSRYICNNSLASCPTFIVYRARPGFETVLEISRLFGVEQHKVLHANNLTSPSQILEKDQEVVIPIHCSCSGSFFQSNVSYLIPKDATFTKISCEVFEGLVKFHTLVEDLSNANNLKVGSKLPVPLTCACPDFSNNRDGILYLVTYPFVEKDDIVVVAERFGISPSDIWVENNVDDPDTTVFPNTTILVPLRAEPSINSSIKNPTSEKHSFDPMTPSVLTGGKMSRKNLYAIGTGVGIFFILLGLSGLVFYYKTSYKLRENKCDSLSTRSSTTSCLSPDLVAEMSKYSLISYSFNELRQAAGGFSEDTKLGSSVYKGRLGGTDVIIKRMGFGDARRTISIYSKINHINIINLEGVCYGESDFSSTYLVFEFARNGCLRDCLRNPANVLPWHRRTQIAFDVATGLHYIHHCTVPSYIHMNITSRSILITEDWRAKIANLGMGTVINSGKERGDVMITSEGWIAPEYLENGSASDKVDVFAFGVVLLELLSAKEARDGTFVKKLEFLTAGGSAASGCFEELGGFMDPSLKDYPVSEALCMAILAKACLEDDPLPRPSTNDILKILARMVITSYHYCNNLSL
ncbi:lysM domain receptor-like kinase 4 [Elaeis guineensis]|uniref:LysM domain receptor-like kinase 4 n=1 Tax=Elaeis guineensis var. tenera TaxID=51953 RepID=A0A6I9R1D3_ELAGV|nr:lysM domain receptor-like kinase 4 [Elaeis guineensis]